MTSYVPIPRDRIEVTALPVTYPILLAEAKNYLRVVVDDDDALINDLIKAAYEEVLRYSNVVTAVTGFRATLDSFPPSTDQQWWDGVVQTSITTVLYSDIPFFAPYKPLTAVTGIKYYDRLHNEYTFSDYYVVGSAGLIVPNTTWPTLLLRQAGGVVIDFTAGYTIVPVDLKRAMLDMISFWYDAKGVVGDLGVSMMPAFVKSTLDRYKKFIG